MPAALLPRKTLALGALLSLVAAICAYGFWKSSGTPGLVSSLAGSLAGVGIGVVRALLERRVRSAEGPGVQAALMAATAASFGLFLVLCLAVGVVLKERAPAILLSALAVYLASLFFRAVETRP